MTRAESPAGRAVPEQGDEPLFAIGRAVPIGRLRRLGALAVCAALVLSGCATSRPVRLGRVLDGAVDDLEPASLALAAERSFEALERSNQREIFVLGRHEIAIGDLASSARRIAEIAHEETGAGQLTRRLARECIAFAAAEPAKVTGYYEPLLDARAQPDASFRYPIYAAPSPDQLAAVVEKLGRTPTRADIDRGGALAGLGLELAWLDDPVARFFLHVQGSGRLRFTGGSERRVGFAASNNLPYRSVGTVMLEEGLLEPGHASATAMRRWLTEHPERQGELFERNPRYIFFRDNGAQSSLTGPVGSLGVPLVAGRSVATDPSHVPRGALVWLRTTKPEVDAGGRLVSKKPLTRFVFSQDTGAAIQGPARVDLFVGSGEEAGLEAGGMNEAGELYVLLCGPRAQRGPITGPYLNPRQ